MEQRAGVSKQDIREKIWDYLESQNLADFPRPVHHRIPNFKGSYLACQNIRELDAFARTQELKVDPDKPLEGARLLALQSKKTLLVPTPRLRTGLFNKIVPPPGATKDVLRKCATSQGVRDYSEPIGLDSHVHVDLVVVGSVAVSEKGWRIGKGEGYADLEYAMMVSMGAVCEGTPVVTIVHDCQVLLSLGHTPLGESRRWWTFQKRSLGTMTSQSTTSSPPRESSPQGASAQNQRESCGPRSAVP
ncbi:methenyltetrahydrofolate synthase domain-containing protein isoform X2 [Dasypus novemcinctus]|uniref:methenyltetrahydrofolate synthase domain-containing protein isoform X2 n=1 Tax=Dasypus novemcinctus TaxID=9361 RepID=UPI0039C8D349